MKRHPKDTLVQTQDGPARLAVFTLCPCGKVIPTDYLECRECNPWRILQPTVEEGRPSRVIRTVGQAIPTKPDAKPEKKQRHRRTHVRTFGNGYKKPYMLDGRPHCQCTNPVPSDLWPDGLRRCGKCKAIWLQP